MNTRRMLLGNEIGFSEICWGMTINVLVSVWKREVKESVLEVARIYFVLFLQLLIN